MGISNMASGHLCRRLTRLCNNITQLWRPGPTCFVPALQKSTLSGPSLEDVNCKVELGLTSDGKTIVCYHPSVDVPYELTQPIERPDPVTNAVETHDQVLKAQLSKEVLKKKPGPTVEELSKMFFTTKHRWYPRGQYHTRRV